MKYHSEVAIGKRREVCASFLRCAEAHIRQVEKALKGMSRDSLSQPVISCFQRIAVARHALDLAAALTTTPSRRRRRTH